MLHVTNLQMMWQYFRTARANRRSSCMCYEYAVMSEVQPSTVRYRAAMSLTKQLPPWDALWGAGKIITW